jgi:hypothetical protein
MPFEFSQATKHSKHQPAMWRCGVAPGIVEGFECSASLADSVERVEQIAG